MGSYRRIAAAAPGWVADLLRAPSRRVPVLHRGADAVYLDLRSLESDRHPRRHPNRQVVGVLSAAATAVPCAMTTLEPRLPADLLGPDAALVGDGRIRMGEVEIFHARTVDRSIPQLYGRRDVGGPAGPAGPDGWDGGAARAADRLRGAVGDRTLAVRAELPDEALRGLARADAAAVPLLLGRGSGLTPVGDDVLCGWLALAGARASGADPSVGSPLADAVRRLAPDATTTLSTTLLECASRREVLPEFALLVWDLAAPGVADLRTRVDALLRVGHSSGAGLLLGASIALHYLAQSSHFAPRSLTS